MAADVRITTTLEGIAKVQTDLRSLEKGLAGVGKQASSIGASLKRVGDRATAVGKTLSLRMTLPIVAMGAGIIKIAADFEAGMNRVQAATSATAEEFTAMRELAKKLGASTVFSATEVAGAMETLKKSGLDVRQILEGATDASLNLAAATGTSIASAAKIASSTMQNFGKSVGDLPVIVDNITGTLLESKLGIEDYRLALGQAGGTAGELGVELEDFNAVLAATAPLFASGSDAGTSFKNFLGRLVPTTDDAIDMMDKLNLEFFDSAGNMKSMAEIAEVLKQGLSGLSEENLNIAIKEIFGVDSMRIAIGLMREGSSGIKELDAAIRKASAAEQAEARMAGFYGAMEELSGAIDTLAISIADSGLLEFITDLVTGLATIVTSLGESDQSFLLWGTVVLAVAAALGPLIASIGLLVSGLGNLFLGLKTLAVLMGITVAPVTLLTAALVGLIAGVVAAFYFWDDIVEFVSGFVSDLDQLLGGALTTTLKSLEAPVEAVAGYFAKLFDVLVGNSIVPDMVAAIGDDFGRLPAVMGEPTATAADMVTESMAGIGGAADDASARMQRFAQVAPAQLVHTVPVVQGVASDWTTAFDDFFNTTLGRTVTFVSSITKLLNPLTSLFETIKILGGGYGGGGGGPGFGAGGESARLGEAGGFSELLATLDQIPPKMEESQRGALALAEAQKAIAAAAETALVPMGMMPDLTDSTTKSVRTLGTAYVAAGEAAIEMLEHDIRLAQLSARERAVVLAVTKAQAEAQKQNSHLIPDEIEAIERLTLVNFDLAHARKSRQELEGEAAEQELANIERLQVKLSNTSILLSNIMTGVHGAFQTLFTNVGQGFVGMITGAKSATDMIKSFFTDLVNVIISEFARIAASHVFQVLFGTGPAAGAAGGAGGGGGGGPGGGAGGPPSAAPGLGGAVAPPAGGILGGVVGPGGLFAGAGASFAAGAGVVGLGYAGQKIGSVLLQQAGLDDRTADALAGAAAGAAVGAYFGGPYGAIAGGVLGGIGGYAGLFQTGGSIIAQGPTTIGVGEHGPERVTVTPLSGRGAMAEGRGAVFVFNGPTILDELTMRQFERRMARATGMQAARIV